MNFFVLLFYITFFLCINIHYTRLYYHYKIYQNFRGKIFKYIKNTLNTLRILLQRFFPIKF